MPVRKYDIENFPKMRDGCELSSSCFECPYPDCVSARQVKWEKAKEERNAIIRDLRRDGKKIKEIALIIGVEERTINRALAK